MALPEETPSIVEQWKKKSVEISSFSNDSIVSLISRGIDTMDVVLKTKSDRYKVQRALMFLESERSLSFQFDTIKDDEVRSLVYGLIESLHFTLSELTKEGNHVKQCGEVFTQTDQIPSWFESPFDESLIKNEDYWGNEMAIKNEEMPQLNDDNMDAHNVDGDIAGDRGDVSSFVAGDDWMPASNCMKDVSDFENEDVVETMNDSKANETMEDDKEKDTSEAVEVEQERESSIKVSKLAKFADCESLEYYDGDNEPLMKKPKTDRKMMIKKSLESIEKNELSRTQGTRKMRAMKCPECEYQTTSISALVMHLRQRHSTSLLLAGLVLRCDCGAEVRSHHHESKCDIANYTVVRLRDGPIQTFQDVKATPQCLLCEEHPKTADGYVRHLKIDHNSLLSAHGVWLLCECGAKYRSKKPLSNHTKECTRREFTLHNIADK